MHQWLSVPVDVDADYNNDIPNKHLHSFKTIVPLCMKSWLRWLRYVKRNLMVCGWYGTIARNDTNWRMIIAVLVTDTRRGIWGMSWRVKSTAFLIIYVESRSLDPLNEWLPRKSSHFLQDWTHVHTSLILFKWYMEDRQFSISNLHNNIKYYLHTYNTETLEINLEEVVFIFCKCRLQILQQQ